MKPERKENIHPLVIWFTGLPGSGKTTLGEAMVQVLLLNNIPAFLLDGDMLRKEINANLGFSDEDRQENIRRAAWVAKYILACGVVPVCCFVSPTEKIRHIAQEIIGKENFFLVHSRAPLATCEEREKFGLYKKAREGKIPVFTGISAPFEEPLHADLVVDTGHLTIEQSLDCLMKKILPLVKS
jgi:adenylylsulfate kinase